MMRIAEILRKTSDKVIFVCGSPYHILITVSLIMKADLYGNCALILPAYSQKNIYYFKEIASKMEQQGIKCKVIKKSMIRRIVGLCDKENTAIMQCVLNELHVQRRDFFLVN